jgi:hypothetical protein
VSVIRRTSCRDEPKKVPVASGVLSALNCAWNCFRMAHPHAICVLGKSSAGLITKAAASTLLPTVDARRFPAGRCSMRIV